MTYTWEEMIQVVHADDEWAHHSEIPVDPALLADTLVQVEEGVWA